MNYVFGFLAYFSFTFVLVLLGKGKRLEARLQKAERRIEEIEKRWHADRATDAN